MARLEGSLPSTDGSVVDVTALQGRAAALVVLAIGPDGLVPDLGPWQELHVSLRAAGGGVVGLLAWAEVGAPVDEAAVDAALADVTFPALGPVPGLLGPPGAADPLVAEQYLTAGRLLREGEDAEPSPGTAWVTSADLEVLERVEPAPGGAPGEGLAERLGAAAADAREALAEQVARRRGTAGRPAR